VRIGVPLETKDGERRVGLTPQGARRLAQAGHTVLVERNAGRAVGLADADYAAAGATVVDAADAWSSDVVAKVKEVQPHEYSRLRPRSTILCYAQLNRDPALLDAVLRSGARIIAYENVRERDGSLPMLEPMSRIAGRLAPFVAAEILQSDAGAGVLVTGVDAIAAARVVVVGAGSVGAESARIAARFGCEVAVFSRGAARLDRLLDASVAASAPVTTAPIDASRERFEAAIADADIVIGAVRDAGKLTPKLISRELLGRMRPGSVLVDVGIDYGGISEASRQTVLSAPTFVACGVVHYGVPNIPARVARTATLALTAATLPYIERLARLGVDAALAADPGFAAGVMVWDGAVAHAGLAADSGRPLVPGPWTGAAS
jgi:alanine dehydrogenase